MYKNPCLNAAEVVWDMLRDALIIGIVGIHQADMVGRCSDSSHSRATNSLSTAVIGAFR